MDDIRRGLRGLWRSKAFAVGAILTFALGIGVNVAVFTVVDRMMFRALPYGDAGQLVVMGEYTAGMDQPYGTLTPSHVVEARRRHQGFVDLATTDPAIGYSVGDGTAPPLAINEGSYNLLDVLGVRPLLGRGFTADDARARRVGVVLSYETWQTRFGGRTDIVGQSVRRGKEAVDIIGILPEGFFPPPSIFGGRSDGIGLNPTALQLPYPDSVRETPPYIRLKPGVGIPAAEAELNALVDSVRREEGNSKEAQSFFRLVPIREAMFGRYTAYVSLITLAASLLLLMCCANLASLMMVRAEAHQYDTALRMALGASRQRVVRSALVESLLLAGAGTVTAVIVVMWTNNALRAFVPEIFRRYAASPTEGRVLWFSLAATVVCALVAGVWPSLRTSAADAASVLQQGGARGGSGTRRRGTVVLVAEAMIATLLVSGAAMTARSLIGLLRTDVGFDPAGLHAVTVQFPSYPTEPTENLSRFLEVLGALRQTPGVIAAAGGDVLPTMGAAGNLFVAGVRDAYTWRVTDQFFETMGMRVVAGRSFSSAEFTTGAGVAVLSERGLRLVWPDVSIPDAIGRVLQLEGLPEKVVIGVVNDVRARPASEPNASLYLPVTAERFRFLRFIARTAPGATVLVDELRRRVTPIAAPSQVGAGPLTVQLSNSLRDQRFRATLFGAFAVVALVLAGVGLCAVTAFEVRQRQVEMGVRLALGATPRAVQMAVLRSAVIPAMAGAAVGVVLAWWAGRFLQAFLHHVDARDPGTLFAVAVVLALAAIVAAWWPARRATRTDPAVVLRAQ